MVEISPENNDTLKEILNIGVGKSADILNSMLGSHIKLSVPEIEIVKDDPFNSHKSDLDLMGNEVKQAVQNGEDLETERIKIPMVDLPLGATEDRVCGTIDIEKIICLLQLV